MITSHDVARIAGVSQATVSRALRDQRGVSVETRARVRAAARELGYVVSHTGRALSTSRTRKVGVVSAALTNPFYPALIGPLQEALHAHGLQTVLITEAEQQLLGNSPLLDGSLDGVVLTTSSTTSSLPEELAARGIPFVFANRTVDGVDADMCTVDNRLGAGMIADLLVELGHTRIGAIMGPDTTSTGRERAEGFAERLDHLGVPLGARHVYNGPFSAETGWRGLEALLDADVTTPTAVFCGNDVIALGVLDAATSLGIRVPGDLTVVGFDDIPPASWGHVGLTTVRVDLVDMANTVAQALADRLENPDMTPRRTVITPRLVARSTHSRAHGIVRPDEPPGRRDTSVPQILRPWMSAVSGVARAVNAGHPPNAVLEVITKKSCDLIGFDYCAVMLADPDEQQLSVAGFHGLNTDYVALVSDAAALQIRPEGPDRDSPAARAFREQRTIAVSDTASATVYGRLTDLAPAQGYRSLLAVPLKEGRRAKGLLVGYLQAPHRFSAAEVELAELLAEQTSIVLHTAALRTSQQTVIRDLSAANKQLRHARQQLEWAETQHHRLMQLVLDGAGVEGLAQALSEILQASITIEVEGGKVLASAPSVGYEPPPSPPYRTMEAAVFGQRIAQEPGRGESWVVPIVLSGNQVGQLWVTGLAEAPTPLERRAIERFALVVGVEVLQRRHLLEVRERLSADLLTDLLRDEGPAQPDAVVDRAEALGVDLTQPHTIALIQPGEAVPATSVAASCQDIAPGETSLIACHEDNVVLLIPAVHDPLPVMRKIWSALASRWPDTPPTAILGQRVDDAFGYAPAYRVLRGVARLRERTGPGLINAQDLGMLALLLAEAPSIDLVQFAERMLGPILSSGSSSSSDLLETLRVWLETGCSTSKSAERLVVHANTVTYRLKRLTDLVGHDLQSFKTRVDLQLALTIWDVIGSETRTS